MFGVGNDEKTIHVVDGMGLALSAIKGLSQKVKDLEAKMATMTTKTSWE